MPLTFEYFWISLFLIIADQMFRKMNFLFVCFCLGFWNTVLLPSKTNIGDLTCTHFFFILSIKIMAVFLKIIFFCCMWNICRQGPPGVSAEEKGLGTCWFSRGTIEHPQKNRNRNNYYFYPKIILIMNIKAEYWQ